MNIPLKSAVETATKAVATGYHALVHQGREMVKGAKYLAGDNKSMPEGVKEFRKKRGFGRLD